MLKVLDGFKVVKHMKYSNQPILFLSCIIEYGVGVITYIEDVWVVPKNYCGPIAVFNNYNDAVCFAQNMQCMSDHPLVVHKCDYVKSKEDKLWHLHMCGGNLDRIYKLGPVLPHGTVFADRLKLGREMFR